MPLPSEATKKLAQVGYSLGDFTLFGLFVNAGTGEVGTYSSHGLEPGAILGFLQQATEQMIAQMRSGNLEAIDGTERQTEEDSAGSHSGKRAAGGIELVH